MDMNQSTIEQQRLDQARLEANGMYSSQFEKDACGMGFVVNIKGKKSHDIIDDGLRILERLEHRGGAGAEHRPHGRDADRPVREWLGAARAAGVHGHHLV